MASTKHSDLSNKNKPEVFPDRYSEKYLGRLWNLLDEKKLVKDAIIHDEKRTLCGPDNKKREYERRIEIDFGGASASTLLGQLDSVQNHPESTVDSRNRIVERFKEILSPEYVKHINERYNAYFRVRFSFAYLYSILPLSMMRAAEPENWNNVMDGYKFWVGRGLTLTEFENSQIYAAQQHSLSMLSQIVKRNKDLIITGNVPRPLNSLQVRFLVEPCSLCQLFINNHVFYDPYLYAKRRVDETFLSLHSPICLVEREKDETHYADLKDHFEYLWRHPLTLFCSDATEFTKENPAGLKKVKPPMKDGRDNIDWKHKEKRIQALFDNKIKPEEIERWKLDLNKRFKQFTETPANNKPSVANTQKDNPAGKNTIIRLGKDEGGYKFDICFDGELACEFHDKVENILFCALAHYGHAKLKGIEGTCMSKNIPDRGWNDFRKQILNIIDGVKTGSYLRSDSRDIFDALFRHENGKALLLTDDIQVDEEDWKLIGRAKYSIGKNEHRKSCLEYN